MRAHAAAQFTLTHFGAWRWAVLALGAGLAWVALAWVGAAGSPARAVPWPVTCGGLVLLLTWLVAVRPHHHPVSLRWDGQRWHLGAAHTAGHEPQGGDLSVAIDLGVWMLLRFTADDRSARPRVTWVPAQRAGHAPQWHALRCAVYSPRPDTGVDPAPDV